MAALLARKVEVPTGHVHVVTAPRTFGSRLTCCDALESYGHPVLTRGTPLSTRLAGDDWGRAQAREAGTW